MCKELKDIVLKKGDIVYFRDGSKNEIIFDSPTKICNCILESLIESIVKIEIPIKYETIYEAPKEILTQEEKEYLENFLRPFRNKVETIKKYLYESNSEFISIDLEDDNIELPNFKEGTMYKGMEQDKEYTLKELGLFE